jgi:tripartite-type tricarboxylate transporter receptor subunit TctC
MGGRSAQAPDLPSLVEAGIADFNFVGWIGLFAPAATPEPITRKVAEELERLVKSPEIAQRLGQIGADPYWMGPAEFGGFVRSEVDRMKRLLTSIGVQPQ